MKFLYAFIAVCFLWNGMALAGEDVDDTVDTNGEMTLLQRELERLMPSTTSRSTESTAEQTAKPASQDPLPFVEEADLNFPDDEQDISEDSLVEENSNEQPVSVSEENGEDVPSFPVQSPIFMPGSNQPEAQEEKTTNTMPQAGDSLSETLQSQKKERLPIPIPNVKGTWVDKLTSSVSTSLNKNTENTEDMSDIEETETLDTGTDETLDSMVNKTKASSKRSNASVFDVSGIMLRMNLTQVEKAMLSRGFKKISQKMEIPNFIKWRNEEKCRGNGVVGYERMSNCVVIMSKKENHQYVETAKFSNFKTKEEVSVNFTSNFTNNKVYRVMYKSMSPRVTGSGQKSQYLRNIKVYDFWRRINQKYGAPDNKDEVSWGLGGNSPYMKASTGFLVLEDPMLRELDFTRMSREDQRFLHTDMYNF